MSFEQTHARTNDPESSHVAAKLTASRVTRQCSLMLDVLTPGPISNVEMMRRALNRGITNPRARISDLRKRGWTITVVGTTYHTKGTG